MTPCPRCNRHIRDESCPFCGEKCVQNARVRVARVARATMFATAAVALTECSTNTPFYGGPCLTDPDACEAPAQDAANDDAAPVPFYGACPGLACPDVVIFPSDADADAPDGD